MRYARARGAALRRARAPRVPRRAHRRGSPGARALRPASVHRGRGAFAPPEPRIRQLDLPARPPRTGRRAARILGRLADRRAHSGSLAMSVHRSCRGQGVGTALLRHFFAWVDHHPIVSRVELEVLSNNRRRSDSTSESAFSGGQARGGGARRWAAGTSHGRLWRGSPATEADARLLDGCESRRPRRVGIPESNASYLRNLSRLPSWVALLGSRVAGAITLEQHFPSSFEVHFMAVRPEHHRHGIGRALLHHLESDARARSGPWLHVKTLAPSHPDPFYARMRAFYEAMGFSPLFESAALWGPRIQPSFSSGLCDGGQYARSAGRALAAVLLHNPCRDVREAPER